MFFLIVDAHVMTIAEVSVPALNRLKLRTFATSTLLNSRQNSPIKEFRI